MKTIKKIIIDTDPGCDDALAACYILDPRPFSYSKGQVKIDLSGITKMQNSQDEGGSKVLMWTNFNQCIQTIISSINLSYE